MRPLLILTLLLSLSTAAIAQQPAPPQAAPPDVKLTVRSTLVMVPVFVTGGDGNVVFGLNAEDFTLTDNGVPQAIQIEDDTDAQPLALAIVVETGGSGSRHLDDYRALGPILDALIGNVEHNVTVIAFDRTPHIIQPFTSNTDEASAQLANLKEGNGGASILDAVSFAVDQLRTQPPTYRRAILLLSETIDQGSETTLDDAVHLLSDTISQLAPPLRLATMAFIAARGSLKDKTAETVADLAGGRYFPFKNEKDLKAALIKLSNDVPNYYVLSFRPTTPTPGIHALRVSTQHRGPFNIDARREYWIDDDTQKPEPTPN